MSRGVRDLRDLICVSRLTFQENEENEIFSDNDKPSEEVSSHNVTNESSDSKSVNVSARMVSSDSGFATNGSPGTSLSKSVTVSLDSSVSGCSIFPTAGRVDPSTPSTSTLNGTTTFISKKKSRKKKNGLPLEPTLHQLPRPPPLPPVQKISAGEHAEIKSSRQQLLSSKPNKIRTRVNFDDILTYMDATIVADWLTLANTALLDLTKFCTKGDSFVQFAHFWLTDFPDFQRKDIFAMEHDILLEEISLAFAAGRENRKVSHKDIVDMCGAVFKEYPLTLLDIKGSHIFLDYLDILTSEKQDQYKKLLSDVRCATSNRQYAQQLLATRSFALVNVWSSILNFYRNLIGDGAVQGMPIHDLCLSMESISHRRMLQSIRLGYTDVIHYLLINGHVNSQCLDSHKRSLLFSAVMYNQADVAKFLLNQVHPAIDVNKPADTGNTALHAASNSGNFTIVEILCQCDSININCINPQCDNATPLHLAVMHGHDKIVKCLLEHGANPSLKMDETTATVLARNFNHKEIQALLDQKARTVDV